MKNPYEKIYQQIELIEEEKKELINKAHETGIYPDEQILILDGKIEELKWRIIAEEHSK